MDASNHSGDQADALLSAAERALFDATARLQEALSLIDRQGLETSEDTADVVVKVLDHAVVTRQRTLGVIGSGMVGPKVGPMLELAVAI